MINVNANTLHLCKIKVRLAKQKKEEEEKIRAEEAEKKAKEAEEKRKRLEEAEKKRQAMVTAQKEKQEARGMVVEHKVGIKRFFQVKTQHCALSYILQLKKSCLNSADAACEHRRAQGSDKDQSAAGGGEESLSEPAN